MSNSEELKKITIFVHGTHTKILTKLLPQTLYIPWQLIRINSLNKYNYIKWMCEKIATADKQEYPLENFYAFGWSGILSNEERLNAAKNLSNQIISLIKTNKENYRITIIGHSHGCNVALNLGYYLPEDIKINKLILLACPVQDINKELINDNIFKKVYSIYSKCDFFQISDPQKFQNKRAKNLFSKRRFESNNKLRQVMVEINGRCMWHIDYIFWDFAKILPAVINEMDKLPNNDLEHTIKVLFKNDQIQKIEII